jgi:hypothetical protein
MCTPFLADDMLQRKAHLSQSYRQRQTLQSTKISTHIGSFRSDHGLTVSVNVGECEMPLSLQHFHPAERTLVQVFLNIRLYPFVPLFFLDALSSDVVLLVSHLFV